MSNYSKEEELKLMKKQGLIITLNQLHKLIEELEKEFDDGSHSYTTDDNRKFQINIINKTPNCSDTWELEKMSEYSKESLKESLKKARWIKNNLDNIRKIRKEKTKLAKEALLRLRD